MATFIPGVTDTPAPMQLYKPDYEFLSQVYGAKQTSYEKGFNYVRSFYDSKLNNPLTSLDNEKYRQDVFKKIQGTLKDASALDLSNPANINYAMQVMEPISKDKQLAYDMQVTGIHNRELQKLDTVRSSMDPKISGTYNEYSRKAIGYAVSDLREAKRDDGSIYKVAPQKFIPYQDVVADLNKAAKEQKLNIEIERATGTGYLVKQSNGELAYKPYTKWAISAMGNKYDAQLQQQGYVEGEGMIRGTMQKDGLDRKGAIDKIATPIMRQLYTEAVQNGTYSDARIKEYDLQISKFRDKHGNKGIDPNSSEGKALATILKEKQGYVDDLAGAKATLNAMEENGAEYVTSNLYNIFTNQAKKRVAMDWAIGHADATKKEDISPDTTWIANMHEANTNVRHSQDLNLRNRALNETIRNNKFNNTIQQQKANMEYIKFKFGDLSKMPREVYAGSFEGSDISAVDVLHNDLHKTENNIYDKAFSPTDGLISVLYNSDHKDMATITPIIQKLRDMANGDVDKLSPAELKSLTDFGKRSGITIMNPTNMIQARYALRTMSLGIYEQGKKKIGAYKNAKNTKEAAAVISQFEGLKTEFSQLSSTMDNIEKNYENIAAEVKANPSLYPGAIVTSYTKNRVPIYDFNNLQLDEKTKAARIGRLQQRMTGDYTEAGSAPGKTRPSGSKVIAMNIKPEEYSQFFEGNVNMSTDEKSNLSKTLSSANITKYYGKDADVRFDPGAEMAIITLKGDAAAIKARNKASGGIDLQESYEFKIPYSHIKNHPRELARLNKYVESNTVTSARTSTLSKLIDHPTSTVVAPEEYKEGLGFDYKVMGTTKADGTYGILITGHYEDPVSGKEIPFTKRIQRGPEDTQETLVSNAERILNDIRHGYESFRIQNDESFKSNPKDLINFDDFVNNFQQ